MESKIVISWKYSTKRKGLGLKTLIWEEVRCSSALMRCENEKHPWELGYNQSLMMGSIPPGERMLRDMARERGAKPRPREPPK